MQKLVQRLAALAALAAAEGGVTQRSAALRSPSPHAWNAEGEELLRTAEGDEPEGQLGSPRRLTDNNPVDWFYAMPVMGVIIWCFLPGLIWNNERMSVKNEAFLKKAKDHCVIIDDIDVEPPEILVDHVVFATGSTSQRETLVDPVFPAIKAENAVRLRRVVEMYQVTKIESGELTLNWAEETVIRDKFKHLGSETTNPEMPLPSSSRLNCLQAPAGSVRMGVFYCGAFVRRDMNNWETLDPSTIMDKMGSCAGLDKQLQTVIKHKCIYFAEGPGLPVNPDKPNIGTFRVSFEVLKCGPLAVLGVLEKKDGWSFVPMVHEHCNHSHALCDDITCKQRQNPHWTGRKDDLPSLKAAIEKIETELTDSDRSSLDAQLLTQQTEDFDAIDVTAGKQMHTFSKMFASILGHEDFIPLAETNVGYDAFVRTIAWNASKRTWCNRVNFLFGGVCGVFMILAPLLWIFSITICVPWSFVCYMPGAPFFIILCAGGCVCSSSVTALLMAISMIRFRPLMSILLFTWFAIAVLVLHRMQGAEVQPGYDSGYMPSDNSSQDSAHTF